jgi:hypothetical protein
MGAENIINIVLGDLVNDRVQLEEELERLINSDTPIPEKVDKIKVTLKDVAVNDLMIGKWKSYMPSMINNKDINKEENGKTE